MPVPTVHAAEDDCLRADLASFVEVHPQGAFAGFDGWERAIGMTNDRLPFTPTLLAVRGDIACDLTHGLAAFLGERATPLDPADAVDVAVLAASAIYVDVLPDAIVRPGTQPSVTPIANGYIAELTLWTPRNGVVVDARVVMDGDVSATFRVLERATGKFAGSADGWNLMPGMTDSTLRGDDVNMMATKVLMGSNADGKQWRITYFTQNYGNNEALADYHAQMHMSGALAAYANETAWGFVSTDPDGILDLTLDGCDCIFGGHQANIHMFPRANDILPLLPGLNYREEQETAELIVGHELFHHFQYGLMQWRHGGWMIEGMARFSETANVPDFTFLPTTLTYWNNLNGMNGFLLSPEGPISSHVYDWSIVWGYLYANEGGMALMRQVLIESATGGTNANVDGPAVIQRAMDAVPGGTHATFAEAYLAFAQDIFTKEGFVWGAPDGTQVHDWSTYFVAPLRRDSPASSWTASPWGIRAHSMKPTNAAGVAVAAYSGNPTSTAYLFTVAGGEASIAPAQPVSTVSGVQDAALVIVRAAPPLASDPGGASGTYTAVIAH